jgi:hypothetical protein
MKFIVFHKEAFSHTYSPPPAASPLSPIPCAPKVQDCIGSEVFQQIKTMNHIGMKIYIDTHQVQPSVKTPTPNLQCSSLPASKCVKVIQST